MKKKIIVEGMSCGHCVNHVKNALEDLNGVKSADINLEAKTALIDSDVEINNEDIKFAVEDAGYDVINIESV